MIKVLDEICTPTRGSKTAACIDLYARETIYVTKNNITRVPLGISLSEMDKEFKENHVFMLYPRSSLFTKGVMAQTGIIDTDYTYPNEIMLMVHLVVGESYTIHKGDKIAQLMLVEHKTAMFGIESDYERVSGIGSTGGYKQ